MSISVSVENNFLKMDDSYTCRIPIADSDSACIINSEWLSSEINFFLLHDNQAWSGKFQLIDNEDIIDLLEHLSLSRDTYLEESKKALTTHNGADNFTYTIENDKFLWKKNVRKNISVKFGTVNLLKVPIFEAFEKVLDHALHYNFTLLTKLQKSENQREALEKEKNILTSKLNELVEKKNEMEVTLYSQFLHLLNEKKLKIKELKKKIPSAVNKDLMQSDESDHFDSDTEIESEEEERILDYKPFSGGSSPDVDEPLTLPKRSRQKRPNESIAGPSGESSKVKNSRVVQPKKQPVNSRNRQKKSGKDSCVFGQAIENNDKNLSETSEDVFTFQTQNKRTKKVTQTMKTTTIKIKYESDEEKIEQVETDSSDKTLSQIDQVEGRNEDVDCTMMDSNIASNKDFKPENVEDNSGVPKEVCENSGVAGNSSVRGLPDKKVSENSEVAGNSSVKGLSGPALDILNQLF